LTGSAPAPGILGHLRKLAAHSAVYGVADVLPYAVNLALFPVFTRLLSPAEYALLALLAFLGAPLKILFRAGMDSGFFRIHYDLGAEVDRRRLAGTVALFSAAWGAVLFVVGALAASRIGDLLSSAEPLPSRWVLLVFADMYVGTLAIVPQALLRIQDRPRVFTGLALARHAVGTGLKVALLLAGWGVEAVLWSDLVATSLYAMAQLPILWRSASATWSVDLLRRVLHFGGPKVPHGLLVHTQNLADRRILDAFVDRAELGLYHVGYTLAGAVKFPISAFEQAWQPFVYGQVGKADAPATLSRVGTYFFAAFVTCGLALAMMGGEILALLTQPEYHAAAAVVPVVVLAYVIHGFFLLTSIGIGIAKQARYYPLITLAAAAANIGANFAFIPRWGLMGAAWATVLSYGVMALIGLRFSQRLYPLPVEWSRYVRVILAAALTYGLSRMAPAAVVPAVAIKALLLTLFPLLLWALRFWTPAELARLRHAMARPSPAPRG
jgi:O-antigen/teichoic acid export membrane protein